MFVLGDVSGVGLCFSMARFWMRRSVCKDLRRNGQSSAVTFEAADIIAYAHNALPGAEVCV
ncbi:hypothetical protein R0011_01405 [Lacticaseibacillus rhamnosus R0011]|nr:Malolactic regulator [Lacticaseibacillus rhamnosus]EHJ23852.1 hypothetical protein R0011_01405 [Lacticaseibacillus rhamnosus R0011]ASX16874.1 Malolactic regulator [Lacticaseibacillus rhamnosus]KMO61750.1 hypothetical protein PZ02_06955 [Lacticaseibacillus rhamnosus]OAU40205.1 hypothetical protein PY80_05685 [Lacticaseibacillus rhamnosus]